MAQRFTLHFSHLPTVQRVLYTCALCVLGLGYTFAMIYIFASHHGRDGNPSLTVRDIVIAYSGSKTGTKLESALKGPMSGMLPADENLKIISWVREGASEKSMRRVSRRYSIIAVLLVTTTVTHTYLVSKTMPGLNTLRKKTVAWICLPWCECRIYIYLVLPSYFLLSPVFSFMPISGMSGSKSPSSLSLLFRSFLMWPPGISPRYLSHSPGW